jgi:hypothetical protein
VRHRSPRGYGVVSPQLQAQAPPLVPGAGYSPGAVQRRIFFLLNDYLQSLTFTVAGGMHHDDAPNL